jgi:hypothetical protein
MKPNCHRHFGMKKKEEWKRKNNDRKPEGKIKQTNRLRNQQAKILTDKESNRQRE